MFTVKPPTVEKLYLAQDPRLRGVLRLDICSRVSPTDLGVPYEMSAAQVAVGERVLRAVTGYVDDHILMQTHSGNIRSRFEVEIMRDSKTFVDPVKESLLQVLGLDHGPPAGDALESLGEELRHWAEQSPEERDQYAIELRGPKLYIEGEPYRHLHRENNRLVDDLDAAQLKEFVDEQ